MKNIYVIVSQTGSIVSRLIRFVTGDKYTHASISLDDDLNEMYSFGRIYPNNPVVGGFVKESPDYGAMKKFRMAEIVVIKLSVREEKYREVNEYIAAMYAERKKYHYNYIGLFLARRGLHYKRANYFYCSEFVKDMLERFGLVGQSEFGDVVRPIELLKLKEGEIIYRGKLCEFAGTKALSPA